MLDYMTHRERVCACVSVCVLGFACVCFSGRDRKQKNLLKCLSWNNLKYGDAMQCEAGMQTQRPKNNFNVLELLIKSTTSMLL